MISVLKQFSVIYYMYIIGIVGLLIGLVWGIEM